MPPLLLTLLLGIMAVYFYIKKNKADASIYFRFTHGRQKSYFTKFTGEKIPTKAWDADKQKVKHLVITGAYASKINDKLVHIEKTFEEQTKGVDVTPALLERIWISLDEKKGISFLEYFEDWVEKSKTEINPKTKRPYSEETQKKYLRSYRTFKEFCTECYPVNFKGLDDHFHKDIIKWLESKDLAENTIGAYLKNIKVCAKDAARKHPVNPFILSQDFFLPSGETHSLYVSLSELEKIRKYIPKEKYLLNVRNWFIIGCFTGLRVSDWWRVGRIAGDMIYIKPEKTKNTNEAIAIPVLPEVQEVLNTYGMPYAISEVKFNKWIKDIFKGAGFEEMVYGARSVDVSSEKEDTKMRKQTGYFPKWQLISSHTCRRSFATNMYLSGIDTLTIMSITGHRTEKSFLKYIKVTPTQHAERLRDKWKELRKK